MNKVTNSPNRKVSPEHTTLKDVCSICRKSDRTAFIGQCGTGPPNSLYLVFYDRIALATNPLHDMWKMELCSTVVDRYVNVSITIERN